MKPKWFFPFALLLLVSLLGIIYPIAKPEIIGGPINSGDVAWMLTAPAWFCS